MTPCTFCVAGTRLLRVNLEESKESSVTEKGGLSRREFIALASASALATTAGCRDEKSKAEHEETSTNELLEFSAADVVAKLRKGEVSAERYASAILERCKQ